MDIKYGLTVPSMRVTGSRTKPTVKANWCMLMVMCMKASGGMTRHTDGAHILMLTGLHMSANGLTISNTGKELKPGLMVQSTMVSTSRERSMEEEPLPSLMAQSTSVTSK